MKYDDCIIRSMDVTKELKNKKKDFEQSSIEEYIYRCTKKKKLRVKFSDLANEG